MSNDKKGILKAMLFSVVISLIGIGILGWQYRQIEQKRLPAIEEEIKRQKEVMEEKSAQAVLDKFMSARAGGNITQAMLYLTENAAEQINRGEFSLEEKIESYETLNGERLGENSFRFVVKTNEIEIITLIKILEKYYIDSIAIAG